jgi:hypothetical protein
VAVCIDGTVGSALHGHHHAIAEGSATGLGLRAQVAPACKTVEGYTTNQHHGTQEAHCKLPFFEQEA